MDIIKETIEKLSLDLSNELERKITEGLERKGYKFDNKEDLYRFVRMWCKCIDDPISKTKTYYVKQMTFFQHNYAIETVKTNYKDGTVIITANHGYFRFL